MSGAASQTFVINVVGNTAGATRALGQAQTAAKNASGAISRLSGVSGALSNTLAGVAVRFNGASTAMTAFGGVVGGVNASLLALVGTVGAIALAGDRMAAAMNRLALATGSATAARDVFAQLYQSSLQTGVGVAEAASSFAQFSIAARAIGATNQQVVQLVGTLQRAAVLAGAPAQSAAAASTQLAQALASGVLQGDELRSLMENMPSLAEALAREIGVGVGELRKMGSEGRLTADIVFPALLRAGEDMEGQMARLPLTMSRSFDILQVALNEFLARLDVALGVSRGIAQALAAAGRGMGALSSVLMPTEREAAAQALAAAQARVEHLRAQLDAPPIPQRGVGGMQTHDDIRPPTARLREQLREAEAEVLRSQLRVTAIEDEYERARAVNAMEAAERRAIAAREANQRAAAALGENLDRSIRARREHNERLLEIDRLYRANALTAEEAALRRQQSQERLADETRERSATTAARSIARAVDREAEARSGAVEASQRQADASKRELQALREGEDAHAALIVQLEIEEATRRAGIPAIEQRTAAEHEAARAIEENVRAHNAAEAATRAFRQEQADSTREAQRYAEEIRRVSDRISEDVSEALFDSMTGDGRKRDILESMRDLFRRIAIEALAANVFLPITTGIIGTVPGLFGIRSAGAAASTSGAGMLGDIGIPPISSLLGFGEGGGTFGSITSSIRGFMETPLGLGGTGTIGGAFGAAGIGAFGGGVLASLAGGNRAGGSVGGGLGAAAGYALAPALGLAGPLGIIGGTLLGGALGGMFGGGEGFRGGDALLRVGAQGQLEVARYAGKNFEEAGQLMELVAQETQQLNQMLAQVGLRFDQGLAGRDFVAAVGGGQSPNARSVSGAVSQFGLAGSLRSDNRVVSYALATSQPGSVEQAMQIAQTAGLISEAVERLSVPAGSFLAQIKAVGDQYDSLINAAEAMGLFYEAAQLSTKRLDELTRLEAQRALQYDTLAGGLAAREAAARGDTLGARLISFDVRARAEVLQLEEDLQELGVSAEETAVTIQRLMAIQAAERNELTRTASAVDDVTRAGQSILEWLTGQRTTPRGGFSPTEQLASARTEFDLTLSRARLGDVAALDRITQRGDDLIAAAAGVFASSGQFRAIRDYVIAQVGGLDAVARAKVPSPAEQAQITTAEQTALLVEQNHRLEMALANSNALLAQINDSNARMAFALPPVGAR